MTERIISHALLYPDGTITTGSAWWQIDLSDRKHGRYAWSAKRGYVTDKHRWVDITEAKTLQRMEAKHDS